MRQPILSPVPTSPQATHLAPKSRSLLWATAALVCTAITACGGGGGSAAESSHTPNTANTNTNGTWSAQAYLKASNAEADDYLGQRVAISGDTLVVGAGSEASSQTTITNGSTVIDDNSANFAGAAYVFVRSGSTWTQQAYLKASNAQTGDRFGLVAISGDTIAVGSGGEDSNETTITNGNSASSDNSAADAGAVYVFVRNGTSWSQQAYLKATNAEAGDNFGAVAIHGDTIVVGAPNEDSNQTTITNGSGGGSTNGAPNSGAAYVFVRNTSDNTWSQQAYLKAPTSGVSDAFGSRVDISGDTIVVGALGEDSLQTVITNGPTASTDNSASSAGAAYVFVRSGSTWSQQAFLKASNAGTGDLFGSVAISGDTIVVGALGEASAQTTITNDSTASADNSASGAGAAYVFVRNSSTWSQQAYLKAPNAENQDDFGRNVAIAGDTIVVGAEEEASAQTTITNGATASADNSASSAGAAYVFVRNGSAWSHQAYLKAPNAGAGDYFGTSVAISGNSIVVGAYGEASAQNTITNGSTASSDNTAVDSGAAYVFTRN